MVPAARGGPARKARGWSARRRGGVGYGGAAKRRETVRYPRWLAPARHQRGRSSMVEPQPSKLVMRFRLPSPALLLRYRPEAVSLVPARAGRGARGAFVPHTCHSGAVLGVLSTAYLIVGWF